MIKVIIQEMYSASDVARILGRSPSHTSLLFRSGEVKTVRGKRKGQRCITRQELESYFKKKGVRARFVDREPPPSVFKFKSYRTYLKAYFEASGLTLVAAAKTAGIAQGMMHGIVHGRREPSIGLLFNVGESFGMNDAELKYLIYLWVKDRVQNKRLEHVLFPEPPVRISVK